MLRSTCFMAALAVVGTAAATAPADAAAATAHSTRKVYCTASATSVTVYTIPASWKRAEQQQGTCTWTSPDGAAVMTVRSHAKSLAHQRQRISALDSYTGLHFGASGVSKYNGRWDYKRAVEGVRGFVRIESFGSVHHAGRTVSLRTKPRDFAKYRSTFRRIVRTEAGAD